jgi:hypothetical protein
MVCTKYDCYGGVPSWSMNHDFFPSFSLDDNEPAVPYTIPFAMFKAACPYDPLAFTRDSAMNVGSATMSATTEI